MLVTYTHSNQKCLILHAPNQWFSAKYLKLHAPKETSKEICFTVPVIELFFMFVQVKRCIVVAALVLNKTSFSQLLNMSGKE